MLVIIANDLPPAVRGRMKLWFIEPRPGIFVSGIQDGLAEEVVSYLQKHCPANSGIMICKSTRKAPGFMWQSIGPVRKEIVHITGLQLIVDTILEKNTK